MTGAIEFYSETDLHSHAFLCSRTKKTISLSQQNDRVKSIDGFLSLPIYGKIVVSSLFYQIQFNSIMINDNEIPE